MEKFYQVKIYLYNIYCLNIMGGCAGGQSSKKTYSNTSASNNESKGIITIKNGSKQQMAKLQRQLTIVQVQIQTLQNQNHLVYKQLDLKTRKLEQHKLEQSKNPTVIRSIAIDISKLKQKIKNYDLQIKNKLGRKQQLQKAITSQTYNSDYDLNNGQMVQKIKEQHKKDLINRQYQKEIDAIIAGQPQPQEYAEAQRLYREAMGISL